MNVYRYTGLIGIIVGIAVMFLLWMPDAQAGTWLTQAVGDQFKGNFLLPFLGSIAAIGSGGYLFTFGNNE